MNKVYELLYTEDNKGNIRTWQMEVEGHRFRTISGLLDGKKVTSEWKEAKAKNTGRANATTAEEQAHKEVEALYTKRMKRHYYTDIAMVGINHFFKPMLAENWDKRKDKVSYPAYQQPKLDGIRCIIDIDGMKTRNGEDIITCPHIFEELKPLFDTFPELRLDGEIYNHEYKDDFDSIISAVKRTKPSAEDLEVSKNLAEFHVYDLPSAVATFSERLFLLRMMINGAELEYTKLVDTTEVCNEEEVDALYDQHIEQGYEGGIIREDAMYENKRSKSLLKRKDFEDKEFEIIRLEEGQGNWAGYAKRLIFRLEDGRECSAGMRGKREKLKKVLSEKDEYVGKQATVRYFKRTPAGMPRFPVATALHKTKRW